MGLTNLVRKQIVGKKKFVRKEVLLKINVLLKKILVLKEIRSKIFSCEKKDENRFQLQKD